MKRLLLWCVGMKSACVRWWSLALCSKLDSSLSKTARRALVMGVCLGFEAETGVLGIILGVGVVWQRARLLPYLAHIGLRLRLAGVRC